MKFPKGVSRRRFVSRMMTSAALACLPKTTGAYAENAPLENLLLQGGRPHGPEGQVTLLAEPYP